MECAALRRFWFWPLNGTYVPTTGDAFAPITYGSYSGSFTATNLPALLGWQTSYNANAVTILVTQTGLQPEFTTVGNFGGNLVFNGTNGIPGNTFWVLTSTNVTTPFAQWTPVGTNTFDANGKFSFTNAPDLGTPKRFFILKLP